MRKAIIRFVCLYILQMQLIELNTTTGHKFEAYTDDF